MSQKSIEDPRDFSFSPDKYRHISLSVINDEATIFLKVDPEAGLRSDTLLKLNSYDLSVDIELAHVINRLRFEYPAVRVAIITSHHPQVFSSGANIYMLKKSSHAFKVNFCKFTNETRLYLEEASQYSNLKFICALNGTAAGGGYELALATDRIILIDDKNASVSLPEVPLLGVLPGTGGLSRLVDKRLVRRDLADAFCTMAEGIKGAKAKVWRLVDEVYPKSQWNEGLRKEIDQIKSTIEAKNTNGITWDNVSHQMTASGFSYRYVDVSLKDRQARIIIKGPEKAEPTAILAMLERGSDLWLLRAFRELDDAILRLRFFYRECGLWEFHTEGQKELILNAEKPLYEARMPQAHWFLREILLHISRVYRRLDVSSRSLMAIAHNRSCFVGVLAEILFACDRSYALIDPITKLILSPLNFGLLPTWNNHSRLHLRFWHQKDLLKEVHNKINQPMDLTQGEYLGLLTFALDEIDFADEVRLFIEERSSLSPDALSAMEANLRFVGDETLATKIFGRLSAWQNWVFIRDNATGQHGALISYGEETRPSFDWERC